MTDRIVLSDVEAEDVNGGILHWDFASGTVHPDEHTEIQYSFTDYDACKAWLVVNWHKRQNEACLVAMEQAGLVHRI